MATDGISEDVWNSLKAGGSRVKRGVGRLRRSYVVVIVLAVVVGFLIAPFVPAPSGVDGEVAIVQIEGGIDGGNAEAIAAQLEQARMDGDVGAVVLRVNSGGGSAMSSEKLYMEVQRTSQEMPVVTSVDAVALSGAYHAMAPSDHIYAKPASMVGSVGVIAQLPPDIEPIGPPIVTTGAGKLTGGDDRQAYQRIDAVHHAFVNAVMEERGDELDLTREEVEHAEIYAGSQAIHNGIVDEIGTLDAAVAHAADLAGFDNYDTVGPVGADATPGYVTQAGYVASNADPADKELLEPTYFFRDTGESVAVDNVAMLPPTMIATLDDTGTSADDVEDAATNETNRTIDSDSDTHEVSTHV